MSIGIKLSAAIRQQLTDGMNEAAEEIIKQSLAKIEKAMRAKMASMVVSAVEGSYDMEMRHDHLIIKVRIDGGPIKKQLGEAT